MVATRKLYPTGYGFRYGRKVIWRSAPSDLPPTLQPFFLVANTPPSVSFWMILLALDGVIEALAANCVLVRSKTNFPPSVYFALNQHAHQTATHPVVGNDGNTSSSSFLPSVHRLALLPLLVLGSRSIRNLPAPVSDLKIRQMAPARSARTALNPRQKSAPTTCAGLTCSSHSPGQCF